MLKNFIRKFYQIAFICHKIINILDNEIAVQFFYSLPITIYHKIIWFDTEQISFNYNSPSAEMLINDINKLITDYPKLIIEINGHSDRSGPATEHYRLSEERAKNIAQFIIQKTKITEDQIKLIALGSSQPLDPGIDCAAHARNRRIDLYIRTKLNND